jgi:hypothetical protein
MAAKKKAAKKAVKKAVKKATKKKKSRPRSRSRNFRRGSPWASVFIFSQRYWRMTNGLARCLRPISVVVGPDHSEQVVV